MIPPQPMNDPLPVSLGNGSFGGPGAGPQSRWCLGQVASWLARTGVWQGWRLSRSSAEGSEFPCIPDLSVVEAEGVVSDDFGDGLGSGVWRLSFRHVR